MPVHVQHLLILLTSYAAFFFAERAAAMANSHNLRSVLFDSGRMDIWQLKTLYGILLFGLGAVYYSAAGTFSLADISILISNPGPCVAALIAAVVTITFSYRASRDGFTVGQSTMLAGKISIARYLAAQIPFLIFYELFFRGALLFGLSEVLKDTAAAALFSVLLNSLLYYGKNKKEFAVFVITAIALSIICLKSGSPLPAVVFRIVVSLNEDLRILRFSKTLVNTM